MSPVSEEKPLIGDNVETQLSGKLPLRSHSPPDFWQILEFQERWLGLSLYASLSFLNSFPFPLRSLKEFMKVFSMKKYQKDKM